MNVFGSNSRLGISHSVPDGSAMPPSLPAILWRRRALFLLSIVLCVGAGAAYLRLATPMFTGYSQVSVKPTRPRLLAETEAPPSADEVSAYLNTERATLLSDPVLQKAVKTLSEQDLHMLGGGDDPAWFLKKNLRASIGRKDNVLTVELDTPEAGVSARAVNAVVQAYIAEQVQRRKKTSEQLLAVLDQQKSGVAKDMAAKHAAIVDLKRQTGIISFDSADNIAIRPIRSLEEAWLAAHMETVNADATYAEAMASYSGNPAKIKELEDLEKSGGIVSNSDTENATLRAAIADVEQKKFELQQTNGWGPEHQQIRTLQARLDYLRALYVVAVKRRLAVLQAKEDRLLAALKERREAAKTFAVSAAEYSRLDGELKRLEKQADQLEARIREIKAEEGVGSLNIHVLEPAKAENSPAKPSWLRVLAIALGGGFLLGGLLACLREWTDRRIRSLEQARVLLGLPVLGVIPRVRSHRNRRILGQAIRKLPRSHVAEAYRSIRAAVMFAARSRQCQKLLITSASSGEGKSTVASNLAIALAQSGRRILLVDADLRRPSQHRIFELSQGPGLSSLLNGEEPIEAAIHRTPIEGLDVLGSGPAAASPSDLLVGPRLMEVFDRLSAKYDSMIVDCPPATLVSDARIIASYCDAALLVIRLNRTDSRLAIRAREGLMTTGVPVLGAILNGTRGRKQNDYGYFEIPAMTIAAMGESSGTREGVTSSGAMHSTGDREVDQPRL